MCNRIIIESVANGYIVTDNEGEIDTRVVFAFNEHDKECAVELLYHIKELLGYGGSKHDDKRIFIRLEPQNGT